MQMKNLQTQSSTLSNKELLIKKDSIRGHIYFVASVCILFLIWLLVTDLLHLVNPLFLPSPFQVANSFIRLLTENSLLIDIYTTVGRVMIAFVLSVGIAIPLSLIISSSVVFKRVILPYIDFIRYIPVPVLIPLTILFFGIEEEAKIVLLFVGTFFQLVLLFCDDISQTPQEYFDLAFTLKFSWYEKVLLKLKSSLPEMYNNIRISLGLCWSYVVIVELVASEKGIGHMITEAQRFSHTSDVFVGIILMGIIGFGSDYLFRIGYNKVFPYKK